MWKKLKNLKKFTDKSSVEMIIGPAKCNVPGTHLYYYGRGFFLAYAERKFKMENLERIEYGEKGQYLTKICHYASKDLFMKHFQLDEFEASDMEAFDGDIIDGCVNYETRFSEVRKAYLASSKSEFYREAEDRSIVDGKFTFQNRVILWGRYSLFYEKNSSKAKLSGFEYVLKRVE